MLRGSELLEHLSVVTDFIGSGIGRTEYDYCTISFLALSLLRRYGWPSLRGLRKGRGVRSSERMILWGTRPSPRTRRTGYPPCGDIQRFKAWATLTPCTSARSCGELLLEITAR